MPRKKDKNMDDFQGLRATPLAVQPSAKADSSPEFIYVDYSGRCGAGGEVAHTASYVCSMPDQPLFVLVPGLNVVGFKLWEAYKEHAPIAGKLARKQLTLIADVHGLPRADFDELAGRSSAPDALQLLLGIESDKPVSAGPNARRSPELVASLERRLSIALQGRRLNVDGIRGMANATAAVVKG